MMSGVGFRSTTRPLAEQLDGLRVSGIMVVDGVPAGKGCRGLKRSRFSWCRHWVLPNTTRKTQGGSKSLSASKASSFH